MFLLGHSHVVALEHAAHAAGVPYQSLNLWGFGRPVLYGDGPPRLEPTLAARLDDFVIAAVGGSAHDMLGLAQHPRAFDVVLPEAPELPLIAGAEILPRPVVEAALRALIEDEQLDLVRLLAAPGRRVVQVEPPPPVGDDPRLAGQMGHLAFVPKPHLGPSPRWLRWKLWRIHSAIFREACEDAGVEFAPHPAAAVDAEGFLRPDLHAYPGHATPAYGALVLRALGIVA